MPDTEYLEIKNTRMYIIENSEVEPLIWQNIDHLEVKRWLNKLDVDFILIQKEYYHLAAYFLKYKNDYDIILDNPRKGEILIHYLT